MRTILFCLIFSLQLLIKGDEKTFKQLNQLVQAHDFQKAMHLLDKISDEGKNTEKYLALGALITDSLHDYGKAISYYEGLSKLQPPSDVLTARINWLKTEKAKLLNLN